MPDCSKYNNTYTTFDTKLEYNSEDIIDYGIHYDVDENDKNELTKKERKEKLCLCTKNLWN